MEDHAQGSAGAAVHAEARENDCGDGRVGGGVRGAETHYFNLLK
jgi:hypothetical protein